MNIFGLFKPKRIKADAQDVSFLSHIMKGYASVYKLHSLGEEDGVKPMIYKSMLVRVHKLREAGLIEAIPGNFKHGAINYRLTTFGLVYLFSESIMPVYLDEVILKYPENALFKIFIYSNFERVTLQNCTDTLNNFLMNYIEQCCRKIRRIYYWKLIYNYPSDILSGNLNKELEWETRSFFFNLVTMSDEVIMDSSRTDDEDKIETLSLLSKDKKFKTRLKECGDEFYRKYQKLAY
jgi:hypothetical protein